MPPTPWRFITPQGGSLSHPELGPVVQGQRPLGRLRCRQRGNEEHACPEESGGGQRDQATPVTQLAEKREGERRAGLQLLVKETLACDFRSWHLAQPGQAKSCDWQPPPLSHNTKLRILSPMESGSGWAGLWLENHWASRLKHHLLGCSWARQLGPVLLSGCRHRVRSSLKRTAGTSYCPSLRVSSTLGTSCRLPRKSSSQGWPSTSSRRLAVDAAAPSD